MNVTPRRASHHLLAVTVLVPSVLLTSACLELWPWPVRTVTIDVLPGAYPNVLRGDEDNVEVAVLSRAGFDTRGLHGDRVALVDEDRPSTLVRPQSDSVRDVDGDRRADRVFTFSTADLVSAGLLHEETSRLTLVGLVGDRLAILGWDRLHQDGHPAVRLPAAAGPFAVGTVSYAMRDPSRPEPATADPTDVREVMVRVWYPADRPHAGQPTTYFLDDREAGKNAEADGFPVRAYDFVLPNAYRDVPITDRQRTFPVLVFSHGLNVPVALYASMLERLASAGYVVFAVSHTYAAGVVVFPDGRVAYPTPLDEETLGQLPELWADDVGFVAQRIAMLDRGLPDGRFRGRLRVNRLGVFGQSLGGAAAALVMLRDARFVAGIDMDGSFHGEALARGLDRPFMLMNSDDAWQDPSRATFVQLLRAPGYVVDVAGAGHNNFGDLGLLFPLAQHFAQALSPADVGVGTIEPARGVDIAATYARAFFDRYLLGRESPILHASPGAWPEVSLTRLNPER